MRLKTRLTERFGLTYPILSAPMGMIAGGRLAAAVSHAGGLGLIGGGYGDPEWLTREFGAAGNARVGCGFITWSLAKRPELLDQVLRHEPAAVMWSFGSPAPFVESIQRAGAAVICQVQSVAHAREAIDAGADVIVAQGGEAGGHSGGRTTFTLVPEVADLLAGSRPETLLVAAGGVADGRGLAAALMLGADGVLIGSRLVASVEAATPAGFGPAILDASGDATIKTTVIDIVRGYDWPGEFTVRALNNRFVANWHGREKELGEPATMSIENKNYWSAFHAGDPERAGVLIGESVGLIHDIKPVEDILARMSADALRLLSNAPGYQSQ